MGCLSAVALRRVFKVFYCHVLFQSLRYFQVSRCLAAPHYFNDCICFGRVLYQFNVVEFHASKVDEVIVPRLVGAQALALIEQ